MAGFKKTGVALFSVMLVMGLLPVQVHAGDSANLVRVKTLIQNDKNKIANDAARIKQDDANYASDKMWQNITGGTALLSSTCAVLTFAWAETHMSYQTPEGFTFVHDSLLSALPTMGCGAVALGSISKFFDLKGSTDALPAVVQADMKTLHNDVLTLDQDQKLLQQVQGAKVSAASH